MMKIQVLILMTFMSGGGLWLSPVHAQANGGGGRLSFLSDDDRRHLLRVREEVLTGNPDLKSEQDSLTKERQYVKGKGSSASADDRETLKNNFLAHSEKMEAAMTKADPTVAPIIEQVKAHMKERFQTGAAGQDPGSNTSGSSNGNNQ